LYVYILKSEQDPTKHYTGLTTNIKERLKSHNQGQSPHTTKHRPWSLKNAIWFDTAEKARAFERYLKSGAGRAFAKKHF
jgi:predicted GIY-YIG superfamily endonuclease